MAKGRFPAIDVMRGLVMVLMTIDHASEALNRGRVFTDSFLFWKPGSPLPTEQFLTRWITHLCAPTFVLLAGAALSIAVSNRRAKGDRESEIDRYIITRGALIMAFEVLWMSPVMLDPGRVLFQVLYAIGLSLICMTGLRRLSDLALGIFGIVVILTGEAAFSGLTALHLERKIPFALLFVPGFFNDGHFIIAYPMVPWLGIMALGWVLGRRLVVWRAADGEADRAPRVLARCGLVSLAVFAVLRSVDGYGNMLLHRDSNAFVQWLHVSKYPPSITYTTLELGIALLFLAAFFAITRSRPNFGGPLRLFGQVALFYYLLHIHLLHLAAWIFGVHEKLGLRGTYLGALGVMIVLYPVCRWYQGYKAAHPTGLARFV